MFDEEFSPQTLRRQEYRYSPDSELVNISGDAAKEYYYDQAGQLLAVGNKQQSDAHHAAATETFHYDATSNRLSEPQPDAPEQRRSINRGNRLESYGDRRFEYDRFGNLTAERRGEFGALTTYEYDCRHRLVRHTTPNGTVTTYTYDAFNRRLSKIRDGETTEFIWQGTRLAAQSRNFHADWQAFIYEPGTHRPIALIDGHKYRHPYKLKPKVYWYQTDHLGTPHNLTDIQGRIAWRCEYSAYGKVLDEEIFTDERTGNRLIDVRNPLRFQGQYEDEESGFFYNLNRYYDPGAGRYLTQDPVKLAGGLNPYVYVDGNPVSWIDPLGLFKQDGTGFENSSANTNEAQSPPI